MLDQILGRPSRTIRRTQVLAIIFFFIWRLLKGDGAPHRPSAIRHLNFSETGPYAANALARVGKDKSWAWRLWVALVGRRAVAFMSRLNYRLSAWHGHGKGDVC